MRILFFGTAEVSVPYLQALLDDKEVVGVVTRPDAPADRGHKIQFPAVKTLALENNLPVFQPVKFDGALLDDIKKLKADVGVAVSYGRIIPEDLFHALTYGCFNIHFSLLPRYRGAAPVQWALTNGDAETGVTAFWMEKTLDTGPIILQKAVPIEPLDTADTLFDKLIPLGIDVMRESLQKIRSGDCTGKPQEGQACLAPILKKEDGKIDWQQPADDIVNLVRGMKRWPGAYTVIATGRLAGKRLKILDAITAKACTTPGCSLKENGVIVELVKDDGFTVKCGKDFLLVREVLPENKKPMSAWSFLQGGCLATGEKLG
jgi:methionyl-tRNA formyltransferase